MRIVLLAVLCLVAACSGPGFAREQSRGAVFFAPPIKGILLAIAYEPASPEVQTALERDLVRAGGLIVPASDADVNLKVRVKYSSAQGGLGGNAILASRDGTVIESFQLWDCTGSVVATDAEEGDCIASELVFDMSSSKHLQTYAIATRRATLETPIVAAPPTVAPSAGTKTLSAVLAVLEVRTGALQAPDRSAVDSGYFTDQIRGAALRSLPSVKVITRENLLVLLQASGKDVSDCEGECEVDTGRRIGADLVISGEALRVGSKYKLNLKLHNTADGALLSQSVASGSTIDDLDTDTRRAVDELLHGLQ